MWRTRFNAAPDVIGKTLYVNSVPRQIVGVMPERFSFPAADTRLWLPTRLDPSSTTAGDFTYSSVARLAPGAMIEEAQRELAALLPRVAESFPRLESGTATAAWLDEAKPNPVVVPLRDEVTNGIARTLWMLGAAAGLVLLVALANVAGHVDPWCGRPAARARGTRGARAGRLRIVTHSSASDRARLAAGLSRSARREAVRALVALGRPASSSRGTGAEPNDCRIRRDA
jgi:hypothetical protein